MADVSKEDWSKKNADGDEFVSRLNPDEVVEIEIPPCYGPSWQSPTVVDPFLVVGDRRERELVSIALRLHDRFDKTMWLAKESETVADARQYFQSACELFKSFMVAARNLNAHRNPAQQKIIKLVISGPKIGLVAKLEKMLEPQELSPEWYINGRIQAIADLFATMADYFELFANQTEFHADNPMMVRAAKAKGEEVPCTKVVIAWRSLSNKALAMEPIAIEELNKFKRSGRQIIVVEEKKALGNSNTDHAHEGDSEHAA